MSWVRSSIGKKAVMAASGLLLVGFAIIHLSGNLIVFLGPEAFNAYAKKLRDLGPLLWAARVALLAAAAAHIWTAVQLARENRAARPIGYRVQRTIQTTLAAKTMVASGLLLLAYLVYHLMHFTFRVTDPGLAHLMDAQGHPDVYAMVVRGFRSGPVSALYIAAMGLLYFHLSHGFGSAFHSLGLNNERALTRFRRASQALALALFLGYISIPLAVLLGAVQLPGGQP